jgi:hypothetical protein
MYSTAPTALTDATEVFAVKPAAIVSGVDPGP